MTRAGMIGAMLIEQSLAAADEIERLRKRVDELSDLLTSARAIAERKGDSTHWERFSERLGAAGIGSITPRTFRVLSSDSPPPAPDVLISKLANLRCMATERHVPEVDLATIDLAIEHLRYFSVTPLQRLSEARMDGIYNAWRDMDKITIERETLLPCPFCGANAEILTIPKDHPDAGAMFVQCCDSRCMTSSALLYPLMDDVRALLVDRWNRRAALAAQPVALQPPIDNAFVAPDCEQFSSNQSDASRLLEILGVALDECRRLAAVPPAPAAVPPGINLMEGAKWRDLYHELLMAVAMKYPGETRHETALRLIKRAQDYGNGTDRAMIAAAGDKP